MPCFLRLARQLALWLLFVAAAQVASAQSRPVTELVQQQKNAGLPFELVAPFTPSASANPAAARFAPKAQFLEFNPAVLGDILSRRPATISLEVLYHGQTLILDLVETPVFTSDFTALTSTSNNQPVAYTPGVHYRGILRDQPESVAAFSFSQNDVMGLFSSNTLGNMVLGRLETPGNTENYILYADHEVVERNPATCATEEGHEDILPESGERAAAVSGCVRVFFEVDYELYQNKTTVQATIDYMAGAFNQLATLYANEQISTKMSQIFVWVTPDAYSTTSSSTVLNQFKAFRTSYNGNLAHLVGLGGNNLGGIAYVNTLCSPSYSYAYSDINASYSTVPTFSWTVEVMTHEMGHNLGSNHTQWCGWSGGALDNCVSTEGGCPPGPAPVNGGTIMSYCHLSSYGINFNNGFGSQPGNLVRSRVQAASCLATTCTTPSCASPTGLFASGTTGTSATVTWNTSPGATSYTLTWRAVGASTWNTINPATSPLTLNGLPANDEVEITVRANCGSTSSDYNNGIIFKTGTASGGGGGGTGGGGGGTVCNAPSTITATATSSTTANAVWGAVSGAQGYQISWKPASSTTWGASQTVSGTSYAISGLSASTTYNVRVLTLCSGGSSSYSTTSFSTPSSGGGGSSCNAPANLAASAASPATANVSWTAVSGAAAYSISWKATAASSWGPSYTVGGTTYAISNLTPNTSYQVRIQTLCNGSSSAYNTASFTTPSNGGGTSCPAPSSMTATATGMSTASVVWTPVAGATSYRLSWKTASSPYWSYPITLSGNAVNLGNLQSATTYNIRVQAMCGATASGYANATFTTQGSSGGGSGTTCAPPASVSTFNLQATSTSLNWSTVTGATSYQLQIKSSTSSSWFTFSNLTYTSVQVTGLQPNRTYQVRVRAMCNGSYTGFSPTISFTTPNLLSEGVEWALISELPVLQLEASENEISMKLQPNPATTRVTVMLKTPSVNGLGEVLDLNGRPVLEFQPGETGQFDLDISHLPAGIYMVRWTAPGTEPVVQKLVKQ